MDRLVIRLLVLGLTISGCTQASASDLDPANPLHCAAQFESYSIIAKANGDERQSKGWGARAQFDVTRAKAIPGTDLSDTALMLLEKKILATTDGGLELATECVKRQDSDPAFQRLRGQN